MSNSPAFLQCQSLMSVSRYTVSVYVDLHIYQQIHLSTSTRCATSLHVFQYIYFLFKYIVFTTICQSVCLSVTFVGPMSLIISTFVSLSFVFICQYIIGTAKCPSAFLPSVCILVYTCPFARLSVRPSHVSIMPTPFNICAIFTARCVSIAQTMSQQDVRLSVKLTLFQTFICPMFTTTLCNLCYIVVCC